MSITLDKSVAGRVYLIGDTYPVKDRIKAEGGHWDADRKAWWLGKAKEAVAAQLAALPAPVRTPGKCSKCGKPCDAKYDTCYDCKPAPTQCKQCGARPDRRGWPRIYRNGICSDCYRNNKDDDGPIEHRFTRADGTNGVWLEY